MARLFDPLPLRGLELPNRIAVSPMCTYSAGCRGLAEDFHLVHLGALAMGGAGLVLQESTAISQDGRISPKDLGLWSDDQIAPLSRIVSFVQSQGAAIGVQVGHAGRKAGCWPPGKGAGSIPGDRWGWPAIAPSEIAYSADHRIPIPVGPDRIASIPGEFAEAAKRADRAGYDVFEVHAAHGYLLHEFLSPLTNQREDEHGGTFENRIRLTLSVVRSVREAWHHEKPLFIRLSACDWVEIGGWTLDETAHLSRILADEGVDLIDVSSGGLVAHAKVETGPMYQVPFSERIRQESGLPVGAVGIIPTPSDADDLVREGKADLVLLARSFLDDPFWPLHAAQWLDVATSWPESHLRGAPAGSTARKRFGDAPSSPTIHSA